MIKKTKNTNQKLHRRLFLFGAFKLAVILQQIFYRFQKGQTKDKRFSNFGTRIDALIKRANNVFNIT